MNGRLRMNPRFKTTVFVESGLAGGPREQAGEWWGGGAVNEMWVSVHRRICWIVFPCSRMTGWRIEWKL